MGWGGRSEDRVFKMGEIRASLNIAGQGRGGEGKALAERRNNQKKKFFKKRRQCD